MGLISALIEARLSRFGHGSCELFHGVCKVETAFRRTLKSCVPFTARTEHFSHLEGCVAQGVSDFHGATESFSECRTHLWVLAHGTGPRDHGWGHTWWCSKDWATGCWVSVWDRRVSCSGYSSRHENPAVSSNQIVTSSANKTVPLFLLKFIFVLEFYFLKIRSLCWCDSFVAIL